MATTNEKRLADMVETGKALYKKRKDGTASPSERDELILLADKITALKNQVLTERELSKDIVSTPWNNADAKGSDLFAALKNAGFDAYTNPRVVVPSSSVFGGKSDLIATEGNANPYRLSDLSALGIDTRFLWSALPKKDLSLNPPVTRVDYLRESARTYPTLGTASLALDHATDKPTTDVVNVLATADVKVFGTISNPQPNVLMSQPALRQVLQREMTQVLQKDLEKHCIDTIAADANLNTLAQGTNVVADTIYKAANDVRDQGFNPRIVAMNNDDGESLDLLKDADDKYLRDPGSALFGMARVTSGQIPAGTAYVIDPDAITVHLSPLAVDADPFSFFKRNATQLRAEFLGIATVHQGSGITKITLN